MKTLIKILCLSVLWVSCESDVQGCTDSEACNYDSDATIDNNSCVYLEDKIEQGYCSCDDVDECIDVDSDEICDEVDECPDDAQNDSDNDGICDGDDFCIGEYNDGGLYCADLQVIVDFSNLNSPFNYYPSPYTSGGIEISQNDDGEWVADTLFFANEIGRIVDLRMANREITTVPESIGNLTNLFALNLNDNYLTSLPESICNQGDATPNVSNNQICPPYPDCISQQDIDSQDTSNCP